MRLIGTGVTFAGSSPRMVESDRKEISIMKRHAVIIILAVLFLSPMVQAVRVNGHIYLEGETNHAGTTVTLTRTLDVPSLSIWGILILLPLAGYFIARKRYTSGAVTGTLVITVMIVSRIWAFSYQSTDTTADGYFYFASVETGSYILQAEKACFKAITVYNVGIHDEFTHLSDYHLRNLVQYNFQSMPGKMKAIQRAQTEYNNNSSPHTYTGSLADLVSGEGAGDVGFLPEDYADGIIDGYQLLMVRNTVSDGNGSYWGWSATAYPVVYQCDGDLSYYIDEGAGCALCVIRAGDIAGAPGDLALPYQCTDQQPDLTHVTMQQIAAAQTGYNNNSSPHTYTGDLINLVTGEGGGGVPYVCQDLDDSEFCGYQYFMMACEPDLNGSRWAWSATAWPVVYGNTTVMTFYIDETAQIRRGDIGGGMGDLSLPVTSWIPDTCD